MIEASNALMSLVLLIALACLAYGPWQWICTDVARQFIFEKRDEIFDMAANGDLDFNSSQYRTIRSSLESNIRFAHNLTWPYLLWVLLNRKASMSERSHIIIAVDQIESVPVRESVRRKVRYSQRVLMIMMAAKSPIVMLLFLPTLALGACVYFIDKCHAPARRFVNMFGELIQVEAEETSTATHVSRDRGFAIS